MPEKLPIVDFHTHILPGMDDGSRDAQMSREMLRRMSEQGVNIAVATPHYYGRHSDIDHFLEKRAAAFERLAAVRESGMPRVIAGAEVAFRPELCDTEDLEKLCIEGTDALLLEMPFGRWTSYEADALSSLCLDRDLHIILAHYERFAKLNENSSVYTDVLRLPVTVQINAESLLPLFGRGRWLEMFAAGKAQLLGSDCHNLVERAPNIGKAREMLKKKHGEETLRKTDAFAAELLGIERSGQRF